MILIRKDKNGQVFHIGSQEKQLLFEVVRLYPLVPPSHHHLNKEGNDSRSDENQRMLDEALADQREQNRLQIQALLDQSRRFRKTKAGFEFLLSPREVEWLLQVLNDVRVGGWLALGAPEPGEVPKVTEQNVRHHFAMETSGLFQTALLAASGVDESPEWAPE